MPETSTEKKAHDLGQGRRDRAIDTKANGLISAGRACRGGTPAPSGQASGCTVETDNVRGDGDGSKAHAAVGRRRPEDPCSATLKHVPLHQHHQRDGPLKTTERTGRAGLDLVTRGRKGVRPGQGETAC